MWNLGIQRIDYILNEKNPRYYWTPVVQIFVVQWSAVFVHSFVCLFVWYCVILAYTLCYSQTHLDLNSVNGLKTLVFSPD